MAEFIAAGLNDYAVAIDKRAIDEINNEEELEGYDGYLFGCPTYFEDMTDNMKAFLFLAQKANTEGKTGGAFGSYTHMGNAPQKIANIMEHVLGMDLGAVGPLLVKEQILDTGKGEGPCHEFGKAIGHQLGP
jgi:flavorubredoxin